MLCVSIRPEPAWLRVHITDDTKRLKLRGRCPDCSIWFHDVEVFQRASKLAYKSDGELGMTETREVYQTRQATSR